jgi:uncharacterized membrane protein YciS (DUF1049 family)
MIIFDFVIIFATCLAIALFSLENTQDVALKILPQLEIQVHLAVALTAAMAIGATLVGLYMAWIKLKNYLAFRGQKRQIKDREKQIEELKQDLEKHQAELESRRQEKPNSQSIPENKNFLNQPHQSNALNSDNLAIPVETN